MRRWMKRTLIGLAVAAAALGASAWGLLQAFDWRFHPVPAVPKLPPPADRAQANRQDLEVLAELRALDRSFTAETARRFDDERAKLVARAGELSPAQFEMEVSRLVATAGNGHTTVGRRLRRLGRVPIRVAWFDEGLFVVRAHEAHADLVGAEVVAINGRTPADLLAGFTPYVSGPPQHAKATSPLFLESPTALAGVWPQMSAERATYTLRGASGETRIVTLDASPPDPKSRYIDATRDLAPQRSATEAAPWRGVLSGRTDLPLVLREPDASVFVQKVGRDGLYVHLMQVMGDERGELSAQLAAIVDALPERSLRYAVLDLRFDGGGDYTNTLRFTKELPAKIARDGRLFILTDHATFSAALVTMARAKHFGGARSRVIGEQVGDREQFWAESGTPIELPNSKILVFFATGYHDWEHGCRWSDLARCFWINFPYDVPAGRLAPDKRVAWRFADYRNGVDTVMEEVMREVADARAAATP